MNIFYLLGCPRPGREAKENIIFFASKSPTKLRSWMAEGPAGLRRLAAVRCLLRALPRFFTYRKKEEAPVYRPFTGQ